jgi:hypothetical protein
VPAILMGKDTNRAGKPYSSDAAEYEQFTTPGGLQLHVAIVATAQGGAERGEQAAKTAVKAILDHLKVSSETDPPTPIAWSIRTVNHSPTRTRQRETKARRWRLPCSWMAKSCLSPASANAGFIYTSIKKHV